VDDEQALETPAIGRSVGIDSGFVDEVGRRVASWAPRMKRCYDALLRRDDAAEGSFALNVRAEKDGRVSKVAITGLSIGDQRFRQCLAEVACSGQLPPAPDGEAVVVTQKVNLSPRVEALRKISPTGPCPAPEEVLKALALKGDRWVTTCNAAPGEGRVFLAAVRKPEAGSPELRVAVAMAAGDDSAGPLKLTLQGPEADQLRALAQRAEDWDVRIARAAAAPQTYLKLDVYGTSGDDFFLGQEIVTFIHVDGKRLRAVWSGLGQKEDRRFDSCRLLSIPAFKFLDGQLERHMKTTRTFHNAGLARDEAAGLRKKCVAPPERTDRFLLTAPVEPPPAPPRPRPSAGGSGA
jgi:hypothetical protein